MCGTEKLDGTRLLTPPFPGPHSLAQPQTQEYPTKGFIWCDLWWLIWAECIFRGRIGCFLSSNIVTATVTVRLAPCINPPWTDHCLCGLPTHCGGSGGEQIMVEWKYWRRFSICNNDYWKLIWLREVDNGHFARPKLLLLLLQVLLQMSEVVMVCGVTMSCWQSSRSDLTQLATDFISYYLSFINPFKKECEEGPSHVC